MNKKINGKLKHIFAVILLAAIVFSIFACTLQKPNSEQMPEQKPTLEKVTLRHSWLFDANAAGSIVAIEKGFYQDEGLDLEYLPGGVDANSIVMVASGANDFGYTSGAEEVIQARAKNVPIKAVASLLQEGPYVFITKKGSGIDSPEDFAGKKIFVQYGKTSEIIYKALLKKMKIDTSEIEEVPLKFDYTAFLNDKVDVAPAFFNNQVIIFPENGYNLTVIKPSEYGIQSYGYALITSDKMLEERPETVAKFVRATIHGWEYVFEHPDESIDMVLEYNPQLDKEQQLKVLAAAEPLFKYGEIKMGSMTKSRWAAMQKTMVEQGLINNFQIEEVFVQGFI